MLTLQTVRATGINWASVSVIVTAIVVCVGAVGGYARRLVKGSVDHLSDVLVERLETKENVAELRTRVAVLEEKEKRRR